MAQTATRRTRQKPTPMAGATPQRRVAQIGRNEPCPCGSGRKYKSCHQAKGQAFLDKLARQEERQRQRQHRAQLKADGIPWYRRLFIAPA